MKPIYLDYNATTPIDPHVAEAMQPYLTTYFGNPSSGHAYGREAKMAVENAREQIAHSLHCQPDEIVFTSGGSESNNYAIKGAAYANRDKGNHIITSQIEHPAVIEVCRYLESHGFEVTYLPVDEFGIVDPQSVADVLTPKTFLISIMHANNEVGSIQPIREIAAIAREHNILMHSDCAQSIGKIPVHTDALNIDLLSVAGHKFYAPKGIGALYIRSGIKLEKQIHGADHERNYRAGTENVLEIVGLGKACEMIGQDFDKIKQQLKTLRDHLEYSIIEQFPQSKINGHPEKRLPNTLSISFPGVEANTIIAELSDKVAASAGAACHSEQIDISHVLQAMKVPNEYAMGTIRFSVGRFSSKDEIDRAFEEIKNVIKRLQPQSEALEVKIQANDIKLTQYTHGPGCACKLRPQLLEKVLAKMPVLSDKNILIGTNTADDAAVYQINDDLAIVQTVDFFTPVVDDPFQFGAVAAANSLSDIYAMGAKPIFALNIVGFPSNRLPISILESILEGAQSVAAKAGISIIGGHTVDDTEPKYGLAVTGVINPNKIVANKGAREGDILILTKPLGTGILSTALKQGMLNMKQSKLLTMTMAELNREASEAMIEIGVNACTDVTGFGLLGHLLELVRASGVSAQIDYSRISFIPDVLKLAAGGVIPGGSKDNYSYTKAFVHYSDNISEIRRYLLNDAQTSGGLLIAVSKSKADKFMDILKSKNVYDAKIIGKIIEKQNNDIIVLD